MPLDAPAMPTLSSDPDRLSDSQLHEMNVTREFLRNRNTEKARLDAVAPRPGERAPSFTLHGLSLDRHQHVDAVSLAQLLERPVALLFGSYTCPIYRGQLARFNEIHARLANRVNFLGIYIREAHPEDGWRVPHNAGIGCYIVQPQTLSERLDVARICLDRGAVRFPMAVDGMDDATMLAYAGSPERLYAIDARGIVAFKSAIGPFDDTEVDLWERALDSLVASQGDEGQ